MILTELFVKLGLDTDAASFASGQLAADALKGALGLVADAAKAAGKALVDLTLGTVKTADHIDEIAQSTGLSTDELQELAYAGSFSSLSMEDMAQSIGFLSKNMNAAASGSKELKAVFKKTGVSIKNEDGTLRSAGDVMQDLADHFAAMPDSAEKTALSMQIFGRAGKQLIPLLNAGGDGLREFGKKAHETGYVMSNDLVKKAAEVDDKMQELEHTWTGVKNTVAAALIPVFGDLVGKTLEWVQANRELIASKVKGFIEALFTAAKYTYDAIVLVVDGVRQFVDEFKKGEGPIFNIVTLLNPFVALLSALYRHWGEVKVAIKATWAVISKLLAPVLRLLAPLLAYIREHWETIVKVMKYAMVAVLLPIIAVIGSMIAMFAALGAAILVVIAAIADLINWFRGAESTIGSFLEDVGRKLYASFVQPFIDAGVAVREAFGSAIDWVAGKINWVMDKINGAIDYANKIPGVNIGNHSLSGVVDKLGQTFTPAGAAATLPTPTVEPGRGGGGLSQAISVVNNLNVTQQPGESGEDFSRRVAEQIRRNEERSMREAMAGAGF